MGAGSVSGAGTRRRGWKAFDRPLMTYLAPGVDVAAVRRAACQLGSTASISSSRSFIVRACRHLAPV